MEQEERLVDDFGRTTPVCSHNRVEMVFGVTLAWNGDHATYVVELFGGEDADSLEPIEWAAGPLTHGASGWLSASVEVRYWLDRAQRSLRAF